MKYKIPLSKKTNSRALDFVLKSLCSVLLLVMAIPGFSGTPGTPGIAGAPGAPAAPNVGKAFAYTITPTIINNQVANGSSADQIILVVTDPSSGNAPVPGVNFTFSFLVSGITINENYTTDASGTVDFQVTSNDVGSISVTVKTGGSAIAISPVTLNFIAGPPVASSSYILATTTPMPADGTSQDVVEAVVNNAVGPVPDGTPVTFTILSGTATQTTTGTTTGGIAYGYYTSNTVGSVQVQAQINDGTGPVYLNDQANPANNYVTVQFTTPPPVAALSYILATTTPMPADGTSQDVVEAVVNNVNGPVPDGTVVTFSILTGTATMTTTGVTTGGIAHANFTSTTAGSVQVQAQVTTSTGAAYLNDQANPANNYVTVQFTTPPPVPALSYIVATAPFTFADGTSQDVVKAVVNNVLGPVPDGTVVTFSIKSGTATMTTTGVTVGGVAFAYFTSTTAGAVQVQAQVTGSSGPAYLNDQSAPANNYVTVFFVTPPPVIALSYIVAMTTPMPADGVSQDVVEAVVNNALGPVPDGTPVIFMIKSGSATMTSTGLTVGGVAYAYFTSTTVGAVQVQALVNGSAGFAFLSDQANPANNYVTIQFVSPPPVVALSYVVATVTPMPADGTSQDVVKAVVNNAFGPVPDGTVVTFSILTGTATMTTTGVTSGGIALANFTSTTAGSVQVQAQVTTSTGPAFLNDQANPANNYVTVQFTTPPPVAALSYIVDIVATTAADGTSQDQVQAVVNNATGFVPNGTVVTFTIQTGTATMTTTGVTSGGLAYAYFTSNTVGSVQVQAQITTASGPTYLNDQANPANNFVTVQFTSPPPVAALSYIVDIVATTAADGTSQDVVQAVINNVNGFVPNGTPVTFTIQSGTATMTTTGVTSGGLAYAYFTSNTVGSVQVQAQITTASGPTYLNDQANPANNFVTVQFTTPPPVANLSYILATTTPVPADGVSQDVVEAVVNNVNGPVPDGTVVTFTILTGTATMTTTGVTSGGIAYAYFTSNTVGSVQVQAQITTATGPAFLNDQANPANNFVTVQFTPPPVAALSYILATTTPMPADGTSQDVVQAVVNNALGPVPDGTVVTFTILTGTATLTTTGKTVSGIAYAYFTSTTIGSVQVQAQIITSTGPAFLNDQANPANNFVTVQFTQPLPVAALSYILATTATTAADGTSQDVVEAVVNNAVGPVPDGTVVTFSILTGTATMTTTGVTSGGIAYAYFTSTTVGSVQVQAQITTATGPAYLNDQANPANNFVTVQFTQPLPVAALSYILATTTPMPADGTSQDVVEAVVNNVLGPVPDGTVVTFTIETGTATMTTTGMTVGGIAYAYFTSTTVGSVQVQAQVTTSTGAAFLNDQANPANNFVTVQFTQPPPVAALSYILATTATVSADGVSQDVVEAVVNNVVGPVPDGTVVTFTILTGTATMTTTGVTSGGIAYAYFTSTTVGSAQVQAQITTGTGPAYLNDQANPANNYVTVQFTPPPVANLSYILAKTTPMPADGTSQDVVEAVVNNALGPVPDGTVVTFTIETGTATMTTTGKTVSGIAYAYFTSNTVGPVQVQAQVTTSTGPAYLNDQAIPANNFVTVQFSPTSSASTTGYILATVTPVPADGTSQDVVEAVVSNGGVPVPDGTVVTFTIETGSATMTTTGLTVSGIAYAYFTSTTVGAVQVQAQITAGSSTVFLDDQNNSSNNYVTIQFVAGPPVAGNPAGGGAGYTSPGGGGLPPTGGGSGSGGGTISGGIVSNGGYTIEFVTRNFQIADGVQEDSVYAYVTDAQKHPVSGVTVSFFIQTSPAQGTITSGAQFVGSTSISTDANGLAGIAMTSIQPGTVWVDATIVDPASSTTVLIDGSYQILTFDNKPDVTNVLTSLTVIIPQALADGQQKTEVKAHVVDLNGNVMTDQEVTFNIDSGTGKILTPQPVETDANGDAYIFITSTTVGTVKIVATVDGEQIVFGSPAPVEFLPINIYVPRVFTPNNDGTNDVLRPILVGISTFHYFTVYNRWGNIVFTTQDPNQGWDGTFKGAPQPVETYLWIAEGIDENGRKIVAKGMTSLVR